MLGSYPILLLIAFVTILFLFLAVGKYQHQSFVSVKIGNATVNAEVADTEPKQLRGLMFRESLPKNDGMLFDFGREGRHGIWMMNMSIPLDIVWLDKSKTVVHIEEKVPPCGALAICKSYFPGSDDRYVVEVGSGFVKSHGIKIGSRVSFDLK